MASWPPQQSWTKACWRKSFSGRLSSVVVVCVLGVWPDTDAAAARSCDEWSAEVAAVEGRAELQRSGRTDWEPLARGERVCSDDTLRVQAASRVTLVLPDDSTLRLDERTTLTVAEPDSGAGSLIELLRGIIHVISRDPRQLRFTTPYANAGLEGTEFDIRVDDNARLTEIVVLEGEVVITTPAGELGVTSDHAAIAREGSAPVATPYPSPIDRMRWASHFPSLLEGPLPAVDEVPSAVDAEFFARRAAARLATARVAAAEEDLVTALRLQPGNATALAQSGMLAQARADAAAAETLVAQALASDPTSVPALLARSYVSERSGERAVAVESIEHASALSPDNALVLTRRAELALANGDTRAAVAHAERAQRIAPQQSGPLLVLGFAHLRGFEVGAAERAFASAVELEPHAPLPRLGLALAAIQRGDKTAGRRELELAVAMDPADPRLRSYMAKVYDAENRAQLTTTQLDLAKRFDPGDPTPWLYSALNGLRSNEPVSALHELGEATERNGQRPVFGSTFALDEDLATRNAALGRVQTELGFGRLALLDGWQAVANAPTDYSGHRLLADAYATEPRHEIARVSELLVSQLLQPATLTPIKPQLGQQNLVLAQRAGPSAPSFDEFDAPIVANGLKLRASAVGGTNETAGHDVALGGLHDALSYSVGHYRFASDGFRDNNDLDQRVANAFVQWRPGADTSLQGELRSVRTDQGDLTTFFNRAIHFENLRQTEQADSVRLGFKQRISARHTLLGSVIAQDVVSDTNTGIVGLSIDHRGYTIDAQSISTVGNATLRSGLTAVREEQTSRARAPIPGVDFPPTSSDSEQVNLYSYADVEILPRTILTAGLAVADVEGDFVTLDDISPKLALIWRPLTRTTVRVAAFETVFTSLTTSSQNTQPSLEPVELAGFTQLLFGSPADSTTVQGLAIDQEISPRLFVGWEGEVRRTDRTVVAPFGPAPTAAVELSERAQRAYLFWTPFDELSVSARYEHGRYRNEPIPLLGYTDMKIDRLPIELRYFSSGGFTAGLRVSHVAQEGTFQDLDSFPFDPSSFTPGEDRFWILDAFLGYRLPKRRGFLSLNADNLLDRDFQFQDVDPTNPSLFPERLLSLRFTLALE